MRWKHDWDPWLQEETTKAYFRELERVLDEEYRTHVVYPLREDIFAALRLTGYAETKVVILGQDPYHQPDQAHGLSFSVKPGVKPPRSLQNIYKELQTDVGCRIPNNGCLIPWAEQGVLLLNTVLTVRAGEPNSHKGKGWETFTDRVIAALNERVQPMVFILWGSHAQAKQKLVTSSRHLIITGAHPSPLSARRGFFGTRPFSRANQFLREMGSEPIDWQIPDL